MFFSTLYSYAYPIDGYAYTGIKRLAYQYKVYMDSKKDSKLNDGAFLMMEDIKLNLLGSDFIWPKEDVDLAREVAGIFKNLESEYSLSIMDITDSKSIAYASRKDKVGYQPGSVGKLAIVIAIFNELERIYGDNWEMIRAVLFTKTVKAGPWGVPNHHTVPFYDIKKDKYFSRHITEKDEFTLYEWLDHMCSKSSNAAASILMREAILMHTLDVYYDCASYEDMDEIFENTDKDILADLSEEIMNCPLRELGIDEDEWKLGGFFTRGADRFVPRQGGSIGSTRGMMKFMFALEQGKIVNTRSSLEIKRLMYLTDKRIRYAGSKSISKDAVYFKSGSLYSFKDEPGFIRKDYAGNKFNYMNSIAIVEKQDSTKRIYMVALMSNVLRKNSVNEHYGLAAKMDELIARR
jgi:hypothetical protein